MVAVQTLWGKSPSEHCKFTLFATEEGLPADCSARLNKLLREVLMLGENVTGTSLRRAVVDKVMRDDALTEKQKKGARGAGRNIRASEYKHTRTDEARLSGPGVTQTLRRATSSRSEGSAKSCLPPPPHTDIIESQGHCYETAKQHYDKQRDSRVTRRGVEFYQALVETHLGSLEASAKEKPSAAEEAADPTYEPTGDEEAAAGEEDSSESEQEEEQAAPVPGGTLEALLQAAEGAAKEKGAPGPSVQMARPSLLDAILANGGRAVKAEEKKAVKTAKYGKPGRPPASKWKWLKDEFPPFEEADLAKIKEAAALKQLIATCIQQPRGEKPCPAKTDLAYLRRVLLWARHKPAGYESSSE